jgi:acetoin utilization deacetylase AcuC-like enzyme
MAEPGRNLATPFLWSDEHRKHVPDGEIWVGVHTPGTELPIRAERIRAALEQAGAELIPTEPHPDERALRLHDPGMVEWLRSAWEQWDASGLRQDPRQDRVVPYLFPHPGLLGGIAPALPEAVSARAGRYAYDTMTLIGPGTWEAARAALDTALSGAELVASGERRSAYACVRPPGHHATRDGFGGSCYLNNSAAAASHLRELTGEPVAVIDVDAHHGNGTQSIFYGDPGVLTASIHVDPGAGWFPHFLGFESEHGTAAGEGANRNLGLAPGSGDAEWLAGLEQLASWAAEAGAKSLVIALGVDCEGGDPESPLEVSADGLGRGGRILGELGLPTVVVQEGGYRLETLGPLVVEFLAGLEGGLASG